MVKHDTKKGFIFPIFWCLFLLTKKGEMKRITGRSISDEFVFAIAEINKRIRKVLAIKLQLSID